MDGDAETWKVTDPDGQVSKSHAAFTVVRGRLYVADLDSTNGVVVVSPDGTESDSREGRQVEVLDGSEVELGGFVIAVSRGSS
jgi:predicted component of type VI protein secretion system